MSIKKRVSSLKLYLAKRRLENELQQVVELTNSHKETGLPSGHEYYQILNQRALDSIKAYQNKAAKLHLAVPKTQEITVSVPDLRTLEKLALNQDEGVKKKAPIIAIGAVMATFSITTLVALNHNWYLILTHWINIHFGV